jgi:hypothetical protein
MKGAYHAWNDCQYDSVVITKSIDDLVRFGHFTSPIVDLDQPRKDYQATD